jgi:competence protein ComEA
LLLAQRIRPHSRQIDASLLHSAANTLCAFLNAAEAHMVHIKQSLGILVAGLACGGLAFAGSVNINSADAATLATELKGIGPSKAAAIVEYRQKHGQFRSVDELAQVKGVNQKLIDRNRNDLRLSGAASAPSQTMVVTAAKPTAQPAVKTAAAKAATPPAPRK